MDGEQPTPMQPVGKPEKSGSKLAWAVAFIMALAAGSFGYLYLNQKDTAVETTSSNDSQTANTSNDVVNRTIYRAEVGKFSINLPNSYGVVEDLDGNFEGGPSTVINIGETDTNAANVIIANPNQPFQIIAKPQVGATLDDNEILHAINSKPAIDQTNDIEFAGIPARSYDYNELFDVRSIIFINDNIVYHIALLREDQIQADMLQAVEAGWTFLE